MAKKNGKKGLKKTNNKKIKGLRRCPTCRRKKGKIPSRKKVHKHFPDGTSRVYQVDCYITCPTCGGSGYVSS